MRVLITGMSGAGKSSALLELARRGHRVVDTGSDTWSHWVTAEDGARDWIWREESMLDLLTNHTSGKLFVAGCKANQGRSYPLFEHVVLLSAPARKGHQRRGGGIAECRGSAATVVGRSRPGRSGDLFDRLRARRDDERGTSSEHRKDRFGRVRAVRFSAR
jgi:hypothetical protein